MIENVAKSIRRKETVDDAYLDKLFEDVSSLYRLDQIQTSAAGKRELGPLPATATALLSALGIAWILIIAYVCRELVKKRKSRHNAY